jgi:Family of unknown function (DUF5684)
VHALVLASSSGGSAVFLVIALVFVVLEIAGLWMVFQKGHRPGWAAIIPFFNTYTLLKVVGRPGWWLVLFFIPFVNLIVGLIVLWDLCKSFEKGWGWWFGFVLLGFIFIPMLGFGSSQYAGPAADPEARDASGRLVNPG